MTATTKEIGNAGESLAAELLVAKGYAIVERNVVIGKVEVDIVAQDHNRVVIVEVKTRKEGNLDPRYGIDAAKIRRLARAAASYVKSRDMPHEVQIDVILVTNHADGRSTAEHFEDICLPPVCTMRRR